MTKRQAVKLVRQSRRTDSGMSVLWLKTQIAIWSGLFNRIHGEDRVIAWAMTESARKEISFRTDHEKTLPFHKALMFNMGDTRWRQ